MARLLFVFFTLVLLYGCTSQPTRGPETTACVPCSCDTCPIVVPPKPTEKPLQSANWSDLPDWAEDGLKPGFEAFLASCKVLEKQTTWTATCASARTTAPTELRAWFEAKFQPWQLVNPDGEREGLVTGYYEPVLKGGRQRKPPYVVPVFGAPDDLITVDLSEVYPELKNMRLRGRITGHKLVPYFPRSEWAKQEQKRAGEALLWLADPIDFFFMQIQGSGQIQFDDGSSVRLAYADQNGYPYRSVGKWLVDQGELKAEEASMQGIKAWADEHPQRLQELLNTNPSLVFFRELPVAGSGPPGALTVPLTPERSIAVDPRITPLGAPVWLATTYPLSDQPLRRLMLAQDTGGAIRGAVRADFYWGSGTEAGNKAGKMRQKGRMWVLLPKGYLPK